MTTMRNRQLVQRVQRLEQQRAGLHPTCPTCGRSVPRGDGKDLWHLTIADDVDDEVGDPFTTSQRPAPAPTPCPTCHQPYVITLKLEEPDQTPRLLPRDGRIG